MLFKTSVDYVILFDMCTLKVSEKRRVQLNDYLQVLLKMDSIVAEVLMCVVRSNRVILL